MAQILVRDLDERVVARLKSRAKSRGRSLQGKAKAILEDAAKVPTAAERRRIIGKWREIFAGRTVSDSTELIREDRER
ncbi:MAG: FitA-like ribbon-helix-helix domain-containing protein [Pseudomonadota bacterium]